MTDRTKKLGAEAVGGCIATRLRLATRVITKVYDDALRPLGLTVAQLSMLVVAEDRGLIRQSEVGAELQLDDSTLSRNLERMRTGGWLEEVPADDARVHSYRLTPAGRKRLHAVDVIIGVDQRQTSERGQQGDEQKQTARTAPKCSFPEGVDPAGRG